MDSSETQKRLVRTRFENQGNVSDPDAELIELRGSLTSLIEGVWSGNRDKIAENIAECGVSLLALSSMYGMDFGQLVESSIVPTDGDGGGSSYADLGELSPLLS